MTKLSNSTQLILAVLGLLIVVGLVAVWRFTPIEREVDITTTATPTPFDTGVFEPLEADREIFVHCGNSMRPGVEALAAEFQKRHGIGVRLNFGGSAELLSSIELGETGDLYIPHDPYAEILEEKGLLDYYEVVGFLEPTIMVPKGNPDEIESMRELAVRDLRVSIPDPRYATAGKLVLEAFEELGLRDELEANIRMEGRSHNDVALSLIYEQVDVAMVWNFIATFYADRLEQVPSEYDFPEIRVTMCMLNNAQDREAAKKFMELATSEFGEQVFAEHGYIVE